MIARVKNAVSNWVSSKVAAIARRYAGAETNRLNSHLHATNRSAEMEMRGPYGADALRAWARMLVRDNAFAWGIVDTIVTSVVGCGIGMESMVETGDENIDIVVNEKRQRLFEKWCENCDINGQYSFAEIQQLAQREIVEAGECLIYYSTVPKNHKGIKRPVPLALELIEADRLAADKDTYTISRDSDTRIVRGVEIDDKGRPIAYWVYPDHPDSPHTTRNREPVRLPANRVQHLFRRDRIGQHRGVTWFAPVVSWLRDLGIYTDHEIQASAVAACFAVAIESETPVRGLNSKPPTVAGTNDPPEKDDNENTYDYLEPGLIMRLRKGEKISSANPGRPNANAGPWINLILRGCAVGTGLSFETVSRDYSQTSYSSNRASQLEDRRRFRTWQQYQVGHLCQPTWNQFCDHAAIDGNPYFPTAAELEKDRNTAAAVEWHPPAWEWVDPSVEQQASESAIESNQSTLQIEGGKLGRNWRNILNQKAKEQRLKEKNGLLKPDEMIALAQLKTAEAALITARSNAAKSKAETDQITEQEAVTSGQT